jgi:hypothetical protein
MMLSWRNVEKRGETWRKVQIMGIADRRHALCNTQSSVSVLQRFSKHSKAPICLTRQFVCVSCWDSDSPQVKYSVLCGRMSPHRLEIDSSPVGRSLASRSPKICRLSNSLAASCQQASSILQPKLDYNHGVLQCVKQNGFELTGPCNRQEERASHCHYYRQST